MGLCTNKINAGYNRGTVNMNKIALSITVVLFVAVTVVAQRPEDRPPPFGGPPGGFPMPRGFHLMTALDADRDGKISSKEIDNAVAALQKLDKDKDGRLSATEIGWPPPGGFPGFGRGGGGGRGGFPGFGGGGGRGGFPGFGGRGGPPGGDRPQRPETEARETDRTNTRQSSNSSRETRFFSVAQLKSLDRNVDGKITKDEIPKGLQERILSRVDTNKDGVIDLDELAKLGKSQDSKK
jgi:hypothetical protein